MKTAVATGSATRRSSTGMAMAARAMCVSVVCVCVQCAYQCVVCVCIWPARPLPSRAGPISLGLIRSLFCLVII